MPDPGRALQHANESYQKARETYLTYKEGNFSGADNTIIVLKAVVAVDAAVGAAAGGALLGGGALAAGVGSAGGAALTDVADQAGGKAFNWTELAEQVAGGFASGFLAALVTGPLKEMLTESSSGYVTEELMSDEDLKEIAKALGKGETIERDFLQSQLKKFIIEHVSDKAGEWLIGKPIEMVTDSLKKAASEGTAPPDEHSAVETVAKLAAPAIAKAFMSSLGVK